MAENKMKEIAKLLGVELGEEFKIKGFNGIFKLTNDGLYLTNYGSVEHVILCNLLIGTREIEKPILDKVEKRYLENVLRPFKDRVVYVNKTESLDKQEEYLNICLDEEDDYCIDLPYFKKNTMYKGMELDKEYTLKELGWIE